MANQFTYLGSSMSSTERDVNIRIDNAWIAIDRLKTIWIFDLSDKIKKGFRQSSSCVITTVRLHYLVSYETLGEKARWEPNKDAANCFVQIMEAALYKTAISAIYRVTKKNKNKNNKKQNPYIFD